MLRIGDIVFDCRKPPPLARFWAAALDGYEVAPYDEDELARLRSIGINDIEDDPVVIVLPSSEGEPRLVFQKVPEPKTVKNRMHLDLTPDDRRAEVARLMGLGATEVGEFEHPFGSAWTTMRDPEGNEFCVMEPAGAEPAAS